MCFEDIVYEKAAQNQNGGLTCSLKRTKEGEEGGV